MLVLGGGCKQVGGHVKRIHPLVELVGFLKLQGWVPIVYSIVCFSLFVFPLVTRHIRVVPPKGGF